MNALAEAADEGELTESMVEQVETDEQGRPVEKPKSSRFHNSQNGLIDEVFICRSGWTLVRCSGGENASEGEIALSRNAF